MVFVDDIAEVPEGRPIMLSAHGSAPEVVAAARARGSYVVDSVCPLVTKVHHEVKVRAGKGYRIVYVGHEGHEEAVGTMAVAPQAISRVESIDEVNALPEFDEPVALLAQTTLSHRDWEGVAVAVRGRYPDVWSPGRSDLCFATTNRQSALMAMAPRCDAIVVIGSSNSSNTRAFEKLAIEAGCPTVFRVNSVEELPDGLSGTVGVTAGASAPEELVDEIIAFLGPAHGVEVLRVTDEDEYFPPPRNIREPAVRHRNRCRGDERRPGGHIRRVRRPRTRSQRCAGDPARSVAFTAMLSPTSTTIRLFLHIVAASVWLGGQITVGGIVPAVRRVSPATTKTIAQAFGRVAWPAFGLTVLTGMWSLAAIDITDMSSAYQATVLVHLAAAIASGVFAAVHAVGRTKLALALGGALGALTALAAMFLGVLLRSGS